MGKIRTPSLRTDLRIMAKATRSLSIRQSVFSDISFMAGLEIWMKIQPLLLLGKPGITFRRGDISVETAARHQGPIAAVPHKDASKVLNQNWNTLCSSEE